MDETFKAIIYLIFGLSVWVILYVVYKRKKELDKYLDDVEDEIKGDEK